MRSGIMSCAHLHAEGYIQNLRQSPGVEMIGFSDTDAARGKHFAALFYACWYRTHHGILAEMPDGAIWAVCTRSTASITARFHVSTGHGSRRRRWRAEVR